MHHLLLGIALGCWAALAGAAYDPVSSHGADLTGIWKLNPALSDDAQRVLEEQLERERKRYVQARRQEERMEPSGVPASGPEPPPLSRRRPWQERRYDNFRKMLAITDTLTLRQTAATLEIVSAVDARRVAAGSRTQVSMPEGQLADSRAGWDGEWFVIERKVSRGPRVVEKYRVMQKTGQLEYRMVWSGDTELAGIRLRRIFDRMTDAVVAPNPAAGPVQ